MKKLRIKRKKLRIKSKKYKNLLYKSGYLNKFRNSKTRIRKSSNQNHGSRESKKKNRYGESDMKIF